MDRRTFLAGTGAFILAAPLAVEAQPAGKPVRIGWISVTSPEDQNSNSNARLLSVISGSRVGTRTSSCATRKATWIGSQ
jgi:hypothetical protein